MLSHNGEKRTLAHNLHIASLLSFVAGIVNISGFLSIKRLTTHVTGHFAFLVEEVFRLNFTAGWVLLLFIFFFFAGSFVSGFLVELLHHKNKSYVYRIPLLLESIILFTLAFSGQFLIQKHPEILAYALLFSMGLQNSLVTTISNAKVRTTHLTGLFTDLGIELSQLFFYRQKTQKDKLVSSITLRVTIICFFFIGGIVGGFFYLIIQLYTLSFAASVLLLGIVYDYLKNREK